MYHTLHYQNKYEVPHFLGLGWADRSVKASARYCTTYCSTCSITRGWSVILARSSRELSTGNQGYRSSCFQICAKKLVKFWLSLQQWIKWYVNLHKTKTRKSWFYHQHIRYIDRQIYWSGFSMEIISTVTFRVWYWAPNVFIAEPPSSPLARDNSTIVCYCVHDSLYGSKRLKRGVRSWMSTTCSLLGSSTWPNQTIFRADFSWKAS